MEWLYHMGVPEEEIAELAAHSANTVPCMMPYITAFFLPRAAGDRPRVVPDGAVNFAFLGQFAETERDTIFTTEYSMRTGMERSTPAGHRPGRARGVGLHLRRAGSDQRLCPASGRPQAHRAGAEPGRAPCLKAVLKKLHAPTWRSCSRTTTPSDQTGPGAFEKRRAGARQKGLLNASGRFKRLFIDGTASTGAAPTGSFCGACYKRNS